MRRLGALVVAACAASLWAAEPALADKRVALVIGNSAYQNVPRLPNPSADAQAIADLLRAAQFNVVDSRSDLSIVAMRRVLRDFSDKARGADIAVIYYAGHGLEIDGVNYLIPVDALLERDTDAYDEAVALDRVLQVIETAKQLQLVILDACRDNPFSTKMQRTLANRALTRGLAGVEPGRSNTLIAFAAKGGSTAADGVGQHSPFTTSLLKYLTVPGVDIRLALGQVRDEVMKTTGNRQEPFVYGSLGGAAVSLVPAPKSSQPEADPRAELRRDYELALQVNSREAWESFVAHYPSGFYTDLAREQLRKIAAEEAQAAAAEKVRQAEAQKARLAAEQATAAAQAKAAADAKTALAARMATEKLMQDAQAKADAAERLRAAAEQAAAVKASSDKAAADNAAAVATAQAASQPPTQVAALPPPADVAKANKPAPTQDQITRSLQDELRRVGCFSGSADGLWSAASRHSLEQFNKYAGTKLDVKLASLDTVDVVKARSGRICPLACGHGLRAEGERCVEIACPAGYEVGRDNTCEKKPAQPVAKGTTPDSDVEVREISERAVRADHLHDRRLPPGSKRLPSGELESCRRSGHDGWCSFAHAKHRGLRLNCE